jgi:hypothetical protein
MHDLRCRKPFALQDGEGVGTVAGMRPEDGDVVKGLQFSQ